MYIIYPTENFQDAQSAPIGSIQLALQTATYLHDHNAFLLAHLSNYFIVDTSPNFIKEKKKKQHIECNIKLINNKLAAADII